MQSLAHRRRRSLHEAHGELPPIFFLLMAGKKVRERNRRRREKVFLRVKLRERERELILLKKTEVEECIFIMGDQRA